MLTTTQYASLHNLSRVRIQQLCDQGRIRGARKQGRDWQIPDKATIKRKDDWTKHLPKPA